MMMSLLSIFRGLFKRRQTAKITPYYSHFAGCSRVCAYVLILSDGLYRQLFSKFFHLLLNSWARLVNGLIADPVDN